MLTISITLLHTNIKVPGGGGDKLDLYVTGTIFQHYPDSAPKLTVR